MNTNKHVRPIRPMCLSIIARHVKCSRKRTWWCDISEMRRNTQHVSDEELSQYNRYDYDSEPSTYRLVE